MYRVKEAQFLKSLVPQQRLVLKCNQPGSSKRQQITGLKFPLSEHCMKMGTALVLP